MRRYWVNLSEKKRKCGMNCDYENRINDLNQSDSLLYGKRQLTSYAYYELWDRQTNIFKLSQLTRMYEMFKTNMHILSKDFVPRWVEVDQLLYATKGLIWDWTNEDEELKTQNSILKAGMYFPIFTLPQGVLHNQLTNFTEIEKLKSKNLFNAYNGNHRIDAIQSLALKGLYDQKVLIYEIPEVCQKSCTGFKYDLIDHDISNPLTNFKLKKPLYLYNLSFTNNEMKIVNLPIIEKVESGIHLVKVDDLNTAFRIVTAFQNVLEVPLTKYYEINNQLPKGIDNKEFNDKKRWHAKRRMYEL